VRQPHQSVRLSGTSVEEHENAITYDYPMFSEPMTSQGFIDQL
jgi:hypothetical protein